MHWPFFRASVAERSMEPTLLPGDWLLVWRGAQIRPGQLVVARHPSQPGMLLVKRAARQQAGGWWLMSDSSATAAVDSRHFGPVPPALIEGRVVGRYWPARRVRPGCR